MYMKNTKSINIYMGIIGEAYVDKETAYGVLLAAKKNILDVQAIIKFGEDLSRPLSQAMSQANDAIGDAVTVYNKLKDAINEQPKDGIIYKKLIALLADLNENDFDNDFSNGGNIYTARENLAFAESLERQRQEIIAKANELLDANRLNAVVRCKEYNIAREIFESMIPDASISPEDLSDTLEGEYMRALNHIQSNISYISSSSTTISEISNTVSGKIDDILNGNDERQQIINDTEFAYWYVGNVRPLDFKLVESLGFTFIDDNNIEIKYQDENGDWHYSDFGVDGPLKANHWFHLPKDLSRDGQLIAGIDGGKVSANNWFIVVPETVKDYKGEDQQLYPCVPLNSVVHTNGSHNHDVKIYSPENNLGYEQDGYMIVNGVTYVIWKLDSTEFNAQRLNVYMNVGTENAEEAINPISNYLYLYVGSEKPTSDCMPYEGKESDNNINAGWNRIEGSSVSINVTADEKIFYVAIPNELTIMSGDEDMLADEETSPFTIVYENLIIAGHQYDVYITGNEDAAFNYDIIAKTDIIIPDEPTPEDPEGTIHVNDVVITDAPVYMFPGDTYELKGNVIPDNATNKNGNWNSSDSNVINVDTENVDDIIKGHATANNLGQSTLTVTSEDNNISKNVNIKVVETIEYRDNMKYWYIGTENPRYVDTIFTDNTIPGWHEIGETTEGFELNTSDNPIVLYTTNRRTIYYLVIPDTLNVYDDDGADGLYLFNEIQCNISGYKAYIYQDVTRIVSGINIKEINNDEQNNENDYYWYIGINNSTSISDIQNDNTIPGWHKINNSLNNFILDTNANPIVLYQENIKSNYFVIIPNDLHIYDADGANGLYLFNDATCDIQGYKAYVYNSEFGTRIAQGIIIKK